MENYLNTKNIKIEISCYKFIHNGFKMHINIYQSFQFPFNLPHTCTPYYIQGISYWSVKSNSALRGRRINHFIELWFIVGSGGLEIWVSSTSFQKSNIGWPQQPPKEKVLKFNIEGEQKKSTQTFLSLEAIS